MKVTIKTGLSTTVKSAQSKKCRMLAKVADGSMHPKVAAAIVQADYMLSTVCTQAEIDAAASGSRPGRGGSNASIKIEVEI